MSARSKLPSEYILDTLRRNTSDLAEWRARQGTPPTAPGTKPAEAAPEPKPRDPVKP